MSFTVESSAVVDNQSRFLAFAVSGVGLLGALVLIFGFGVPWYSNFIIGILLFSGLGLVADIPLVPQSYKISDKGITIKRRWSSSVIKPLMITRAEVVDLESFAVKIPVLGWPLGSGLTGFFFVPGRGIVTFYTHRTGKVVLVHTLQGLIVISPDKPVRFVDGVNEMLRRKARGIIR